MSCGAHHAGTSQTKPSRTATKKRGPKPKGKRPWDCARDTTSAGTSGRGGFTTLPPFSRASFSWPSLGNFHGGNHLVDDLIGCKSFEVRFRFEQKTMAKNGRRGSFYVIGQKIVAAVHARNRASNKKKADGSAGAGAERNRRPIASAAGQGNHIRMKGRLNTHAGDFAARCGKKPRRERSDFHLIEAVGIKTLFVLRENFHFFLSGRIGDANFKKEAVELSFRKRVGALEFDGILRGEDGEVFRERIANAVDGDLALFHGFQQRGLRARGSAVDFVDKKKVGENGTAMQRKRVAAEVEDVSSGDVGRHEVSGALHALKAEATDAREAFDRQRLGKTGNAFHNGVAAANEDEEKLVHDFALADDDFGKFRANVRCECGKILHGQFLSRR